MARIGYARFNTLDQYLYNAKLKLRAGRACSQEVSGGSRECRLKLATVLDFLRNGDELVSTGC